MNKTIKRWIKLVSASLALTTLIGIFIPASASTFIHPYDSDKGSTLFDNPDWMRRIPDDTLLSDLSIPGTWNSDVIDGSEKGIDDEATQVVGIGKQLQSGIRALSLTVEYVLAAGSKPGKPAQWVMPSLEPSLSSIASFLAAHPGETVILRLNGASNSTQLAQLITSAWASPKWDKYLWKPGHRNPAIPKLSEVRGKIVVIQGPAIAHLNFSFAEEAGNPLFNVQNDNFMLDDWMLYQKWARVKTQLAKAAANWQRGVFFTNTLHAEGRPSWFAASGTEKPALGSAPLSTGFLSTYGENGWEDFSRVLCIGDYWLCTIAYTGVNQMTLDFIETANPVYVGILWADFPGRGLIDAIVHINQPARPQVQVVLRNADQCLDVVGGETPGTTTDVKVLAAVRCSDSSLTQQWFVRDDGVIRWMQDTTRCVLANKGVLDGRALSLGNCGEAISANLIRANDGATEGLVRLGAAMNLCMQGRSDKIVLSTCNAAAPSQLWSLRRFSTLLVAGQDRCVHAPDFAEMNHGAPIQVRRCNPEDAHQLWLMNDRGAVFAPGLDSGCLGASNDLSSAAAIYSGCKDGSNQKWGMRPDGTLRPLSRPGSCLDLAAIGIQGIGAASVNVCEDGKASQQFAFSTAAVQLHWRDNRCMQSTGSKTANGNPVVSSNCDSRKNLQWSMRGDQTMRSSGDDTLCLDIPRGQAMRQGQPLVMNACDGSDNQKWSWMANRRIRPRTHDGLCIETPNSRLKQGTALRVAACSEQDLPSQRWTPR